MTDELLESISEGIKECREQNIERVKLELHATEILGTSLIYCNKISTMQNLNFRFNKYSTV